MNEFDESAWRRQLREVAEKALAERERERLNREADRECEEWQDTLAPEILNVSIGK